MSARETPDTQAAVTVGDMRAIIRSLVGTGIVLATLMLILIGLVLQSSFSGSGQKSACRG